MAVSEVIIGDTSPCLSINILDDMERESCDQTFTVSLTTSNSSVTLFQHTATVTIYDNEGLPLIQQFSIKWFICIMCCFFHRATD